MAITTRPPHGEVSRLRSRTRSGCQARRRALCEEPPRLLVGEGKVPSREKGKQILKIKSLKRAAIGAGGDAAASNAKSPLSPFIF